MFSANLYAQTKTVTVRGNTKTTTITYDDGSEDVTIESPCCICGGNGHCKARGGSGVQYGPYGAYSCLTCFGGCKCIFCGGKGVTVQTMHVPASAPAPTYTGSTGSYDSGYSSGTTSNGRRCSGCNGTGQCTMCKGKGWYKNTYDGNIYDCPSCHNGRCGVCFGKGIIN